MSIDSEDLVPVKPNSKTLETFSRKDGERKHATRAAASYALRLRSAPRAC